MVSAHLIMEMTIPVVIGLVGCGMQEVYLAKRKAALHALAFRPAKRLFGHLAQHSERLVSVS